MQFSSSLRESSMCIIPTISTSEKQKSPGDDGALLRVPTGVTSTQIIAESTSSQNSDNSLSLAEKPVSLSVIPDVIPPELSCLDRWVCWEERFDDERGEYTKVPISPKTGCVSSVTSHSTCAGFEAALGKYEKNGYSGIGLCSFKRTV